MLQREFRHVHCPFSPVPKTAVRKPLVFSSTFLFSLGKGRSPVLFLQNPLHRWAQTCTAKWHIAACQGLMQHFTSRFEQLQRKPQKQWHLSQSAGFTPGSLHSVFHRLWRGSRQLARSREPAHQTLSHFAAGTTSKDWELPCAPHPSHSQLRFLQQPQHLSSYTQISPKNLNFQTKMELAAVWLAAAGFC